MLGSSENLFILIDMLLIMIELPSTNCKSKSEFDLILFNLTFYVDCGPIGILFNLTFYMDCGPGGILFNLRIINCHSH